MKKDERSWFKSPLCWRLILILILCIIFLYVQLNFIFQYTNMIIVVFSYIILLGMMCTIYILIVNTVSMIIDLIKG